eukprot:15430784-Alexandrium_andersonii.AAC.1
MAEVADVDERAGRALHLAPPSRQGLLRVLFSGGAQCNHQLHAAGLVDDTGCWCGADDQTLPHL